MLFDWCSLIVTYSLRSPCDIFIYTYGPLRQFTFIHTEETLTAVQTYNSKLQTYVLNSNTISFFGIPGDILQVLNFVKTFWQHIFNFIESQLIICIGSKYSRDKHPRKRWYSNFSGIQNGSRCPRSIKLQSNDIKWLKMEIPTLYPWNNQK
jgi:hypothetical protein